MDELYRYLDRLNTERVRAWNEAQDVIRSANEAGRPLDAEESAKLDKINEAIDGYDAQIREMRERAERTREAEVAREAYAPVLQPADEARQAQAEVDDVTRFLKGEIRSLDLDIAQVAAEKHAIRSGLTGAELRTNVKVTAALGGNTVPTSFLRSLYDYLEQYSGLRQTNVRVITTASGENLDMPTVATHGTAAIVGEGTALASVDPTFSKVTLGAWKYGQLLQITRELIEDSGVDILGWIAEDMGKNLARQADVDWVTGSGSNKPKGIVGIYATAVTGQNGATGLPSYPNLVDTVYSIAAPYRDRGGYWLCRDATIGKLRGIVDTTNRPIWEPSSQVGTPDRLLGYPVVSDPNVPAMGTSIGCLVFGDFSGHVIREASTIRVERSDDFAFDKDVVTYRGTYRTDSNVLDAAAIRVYKGGTA